MDGYRIGELARLTGYAKDTIRYYERNGLIPAPPRLSSGYRLYPVATLERLLMVRRAKELGFSLSEIGELLDIMDHRDDPCHHLHCRLINKIEEVEGRISELNRLRSVLQELRQNCAPSTPIRQCPILGIFSATGKISSLLAHADEAHDEIIPTVTPVAAPRRKT